MKKIILLLLVPLLLGGCAMGAHEAGDLNFIKTLGFDIDEGINVTACTRKEDGSYHGISAMGEDVTGAMEGLIVASPRTPVYAHTDLALFGTDFSSQNLNSAMQALCEIRRGISVAFLDTKAEDALSKEHEEQAATLLVQIENAAEASGVVTSNADMFFLASQTGNKLAYMPYVTVEESSYAISGIAVFHSGDFVMTLTGDGAKGLKILLQSAHPLITEQGKIVSYSTDLGRINYAGSLEVYASPNEMTRINIQFDYTSSQENVKNRLEERVCEYVRAALEQLLQDERTASAFTHTPLYTISATGTHVSG